ncbi:MAG TPA: hypothetical protein PKE25_13960 [Novosphingobium sp.]|nr:hypothetical protein [Novosphingobium sp.]
MSPAFRASLVSTLGALVLAAPALAQSLPDDADDPGGQRRIELNREQAEFARRQLQENEDSQRAHDRAVLEREELIVRQAARHRAEIERLAREHELAMERWRADVEACRKGDRSRCAQP